MLDGAVRICYLTDMEKNRSYKVRMKYRKRTQHIWVRNVFQSDFGPAVEYEIDRVKSNPGPWHYALMNEITILEGTG